MCLPALVEVSVASMNEPVFVLGNPRSGTSLLRLMLTSHSEVVIPPEAGFMCWLHAKYAPFSKYDWRDTSKLALFCADVAGSKKFDTWNLATRDVVASLASSRPETYAEACECVYKAFVQKTKPSATRWGDKNNFHCGRVHVLRSLFPKAQFLHIVRDPRDVACSYRDVMNLASQSPYRPNLPVNFEQIAQQWIENVSSVRMTCGHMPAWQRCVIRYEDLVNSSGETLSGICRWLGLEFEAEMLRFNEKNKAECLEPETTLDWKRRTLDPPTASRVGRYVRDLTIEERVGIEAVAGAEMERFGYAV